jgi:hypothetical protein
VSISIKSVAVAAGLLAACGCQARNPDDCERALARIARIDASRSMPRASATHTKDALEQCRHSKYAAYDPVLRCAMDAPSDAAAASCIDRFVNSTLKPGAAGGGGLNPLLE